MKSWLILFFVLMPIIFISNTSYADVIYSEDFEADDGGYTHGGANDDWNWGFAGSSNCWGTDTSDYYSHDSNQWLSSVSINLSSLDLSETVIIKFIYYAYLNYDDHFYFDYSTDGGTTWNTYASDLTNDQYNWYNYQYEILSISGDTLILRWRLTSDSLHNAWGLYIDNVQVEGTPLPPICEGDFDHDGDVDGSDLATFAADFGRTNCPIPTNSSLLDEVYLLKKEIKRLKAKISQKKALKGE